MVKRKATPRLDRLFTRISKLTSEIGKKAALAARVGITPQRLNDWMAGRYEPGGEATLHLLEWVSAQEAKQTKKHAGSAVTRPALKTRTKRKSDHEKPISSGSS